MVLGRARAGDPGDVLELQLAILVAVLGGASLRADPIADRSTAAQWAAGVVAASDG